MKKIFLVLAFILLGNFAFANNGMVGSPLKEVYSIENIQTNENLECKFIEYKVIGEVCHYRECTISTVQGPNGDIYIEKTCSEWVEIPCPSGGPRSNPLEQSA